MTNYAYCNSNFLVHLARKWCLRARKHEEMDWQIPTFLLADLFHFHFFNCWRNNGVYWQIRLRSIFVLQLCTWLGWIVSSVLSTLTFVWVLEWLYLGFLHRCLEHLRSVSSHTIWILGPESFLELRLCPSYYATLDVLNGLFQVSGQLKNVAVNGSGLFMPSYINAVLRIERVHFHTKPTHSNHVKYTFICLPILASVYLLNIEYVAILPLVIVL